MTDTRPIIVQQWGHIVFPERQADFDMALASLSLGGFVLKSVIDTYFEEAAPGYWEKRRDAWVYSMEVLSGEVTIGEETFEVYFANQSWMTDLAAAFMLGEVSLESPFDLILNFYNRVVTLEP